MWSSPAHKKRREINKPNRTKLKYTHIMGSKAFVVARAEIGDTEHNGVEPDRIEFYKRSHFSEEKGWSNSEAESNYKQMENLKDMFYESEESPMTIDEIVDVVLGKKSGYIKGLRYGPKPKTTRATQRRALELEDALRKAKVESAAIQTDLQERLHADEAKVTRQDANAASQNSKIEALHTQFGDLSKRQAEMFRKMNGFKDSSSSSPRLERYLSALLGKSALFEKQSRQLYLRLLLLFGAVEQFKF